MSKVYATVLDLELLLRHLGGAGMHEEKAIGCFSTHVRLIRLGCLIVEVRIRKRNSV